MNTLNADEFEELSRLLVAAKTALNKACEILAENRIDTKLGEQMQEFTGTASNQVSNAIYATRQEWLRLNREAQEKITQ